MRLAVVLYNLGGPADLAGVKPFLRSLFNDPAIIGLPQPLRALVAWIIATRRAPVARAIYAKLGGGSPILSQTLTQAETLKHSVTKRMPQIMLDVFVAMRHAPPDIASVIGRIQGFDPDRIFLCPLYPQFSTTSTGSFLSKWAVEARKAKLKVPVAALCCYPISRGFVAAHAALIRDRIGSQDVRSLRLLFSAHGLPKRVVERGDPYQWQIEQTAHAVVRELGLSSLDWRVCYQSRVGPLEWLAPTTEDEIRRAAADGKGVIVVPIAFVSEHAETLVELDGDYAALARDQGVKPYIRVPALGTQQAYMDALSEAVLAAMAKTGIFTLSTSRLCPAKFGQCPHRETPERKEHG